jgi:hypothetical protein
MRSIDPATSISIMNGLRDSEVNLSSRTLELLSYD